MASLENRGLIIQTRGTPAGLVFVDRLGGADITVVAFPATTAKLGIEKFALSTCRRVVRSPGAKVLGFYGTALITAGPGASLAIRRRC